MATINYVTEADVDGGFVKVEWAGMGPGDDAQPFVCNGLRLGSVQYSGDFGVASGVVRMTGSNELTPTNFGEFAFSQFPRLQAAPVEDFCMGAIRPLVDADIVSVGVALILVLRK